MELQLPLGLGLEAESPPSLWLIAADGHPLRLVREALLNPWPTLIDAPTGRQVIGPHDAVFLRVGDDRFEPMRGAAALMAELTQEPGDLTDHLLRRIVGVDDSAHELLCFARGATYVEEEWLPLSDLEDIFGQIRGPGRDRDPRRRLELCEQALTLLDDHHGLLRSVLLGQAARLHRVIHHPAAPDTAWSAEALRLAGSSLGHMARVAQAVTAAATQLSFFEPPAPPGSPRDCVLSAFPVMALRMDLDTLGRRAIGASFTGSILPVDLDEARLARVFGHVSSRRLIASVDLAPDVLPQQLLRVVVDYEVRRRLRSLLPPRPGALPLRVWIEDLAGTRLTPPRRSCLGNTVNFEYSDALICSEQQVEGVVAFESSLGVGARRRFRLPRIA